MNFRRRHTCSYNDRHVPTKKVNKKYVKLKNKPWLSHVDHKEIFYLERKKGNLTMKMLRGYLIYLEIKTKK